MIGTSRWEWALVAPAVRLGLGEKLGTIVSSALRRERSRRRD
jgi:hypothetical protein